MAAIAGGAAGGAVVLALIVGLIIWRMRRRSSKSRRSGRAGPDDYLNPNAPPMQDMYQSSPTMSELPARIIPSASPQYSSPANAPPDHDLSKHRTTLLPRYSTLEDQLKIGTNSLHTETPATAHELPLTETRTTSPISRKSLSSPFSYPSVHLSPAVAPAELDSTASSRSSPLSPSQTHQQGAAAQRRVGALGGVSPEMLEPGSPASERRGKAGNGRPGLGYGLGISVT